MTDELIDLTTMQPSKPLRVGFKPSDLMWIVVVGGVPCAREAFRYFLPGRPTVVDQLKVLAELIAAAGEAKAKSLKVRISTAARTRWELPGPVRKPRFSARTPIRSILKSFSREHQPAPVFASCSVSSMSFLVSRCESGGGWKSVDDDPCVEQIGKWGETGLTVFISWMQTAHWQLPPLPNWSNWRGSASGCHREAPRARAECRGDEWCS